MFSFGSNENGQLGIESNKGSRNFTCEPQKVNLPPCKQISCCGTSSICLSDNGDLYGFGCSSYGQLGLGSTDNVFSPTKIEPLNDIDFVTCSGGFSICKTNNNEVYVWGNNEQGQLGVGNRNILYTPYKCENWIDATIVDIKCGSSHTIVLTSNQEVYSCGWNQYSQLGRTSEEIFSDIPFSSTLKKIDELSDIIRIECGINHSICIDSNGNLFVFGHNTLGQLGLGDRNNRNKPIKHPSLSNIVDILCGGHCTFVKTSNNEIYAFGRNDNSQLGIKTEHKIQITPIRVFEDNEDIWFSNINKSKQKSARF